MPFAVDNSLHCSGYSPLFRERDRDTPLFVASCGKRQDSVVHQRLPWCPTGVISPDAGEAGEGAVCRLITDSTRLLMGNTSTIFCAEYLDLKQSATNPSSGSSKSSGRLHGWACLPSYVSLYITWNPSLSLAYSVCTPAQRSTHEPLLCSECGCFVLPICVHRPRWWYTHSFPLLVNTSRPSSSLD